MPKWQISLTRDASQDASVIIEAETAEEAEQIFLHEMDRDAIEWTEGDWLGDTEIVEVLPADDGAELTPLTAPETSPGQVDGELALSERLGSIASGSLDMIENNHAGQGRVFFGPEQVRQLRHLADRLGVIAGELTTPSPTSPPNACSSGTRLHRPFPG
jgi:hypothetical protein